MAEGSLEQDKEKVAPGRLVAGDQPPKRGGRSAPGRLTLTSEMDEGVPLPSPLRAKFEASLGRDLSAVRIHTNDAAHEQAAGFNARAYALGNDIFFAKGQFNPGTREGDHLIAHEVAHTQQQQGAMASLGKPTVAATTTTTTPGDRAETNADAVALAMLRGKPASVTNESAAVARKGETESIEVPAEAKDAGGGGAAAGADAKGGEGATEELKVERIGAEELEGTEPVGPPQRLEEGKAEIKAKLDGLPKEGGAEELKNGGPKVEGAGGGGGGGGEQVELTEEMKNQIAAAKADAEEGARVGQAEGDAFKTEMKERADRFDEEQQALTIEQLKTMSPADKRSTLIEMGFPEKDVKKMKDAELDGIIEGKVATEQRKTRILGMTEDELAQLSPDRKMQFLVDLGVDRGDLQKIGPQKTAAAFDDVIRQSKIPGQHKVKIKIKGGLFGKSWEVKVDVDAEGSASFDVQKKGGFFSKLWGWVKAALPIIAILLAGVTGGASLVALAVYQAVSAIAKGDWLGAIIGVAGALVSIGALKALTDVTKGAGAAFKNIGQVAGKVQKVAESAKAAMMAAKAKSPGGLLAALAGGASAFASIAEKSAQKLADTMNKWGDRLEKWSNIVQGGEKVIGGIKTGDPAAAVAGAFDAAAAAVSKKDKDKNETSEKAKDLKDLSKIAGFASAGTKAAKGKPPDYAGIVDSAMSIAGELKAGQGMDDAVKITSAAARLTRAIQKNDPGELAAAALGVAEAIQNAKYDAGHTGKDGKPASTPEEKEAISKRYKTIGNVTKLATTAIKAAAAKPRPDYIAALDAATGLIAELTESKLVDRAALLTGKFDAWTKAVKSKNEAAIIAAGRAFGEAIDSIREEVKKERDEAKKALEANLAPGETVPDDAGPAEIPRVDLTIDVVGTEEVIPLIGPGLITELALPDSTPVSESAPKNGRESTPDGNYTVASGDTLSAIAQRFHTSVSAIKGSNPQLVGDRIYIGQQLVVPGAGVDKDGDGKDDKTGIELDVTVPKTGPAPAGVNDPAHEKWEIPAEVKKVWPVVKAFAACAAEWEHPGLKELFGTWDAWTKTIESYGKAGQTNLDAYKSALNGLKAIQQTEKFLEVAKQEFDTLRGQVFDGSPLDEAAQKKVEKSLARLAKFKSALGGVIRVANLPLALMDAADKLPIIYGYKSNGQPATVMERINAAKALYDSVGKLKGEFTWVLEICGQVTSNAAKLITKYAPKSTAAAAEAIAKVRGAMAKWGSEAVRVTMEYITPILEKIAASEGGTAATKFAEGVVAKIGKWGVAIAARAAESTFLFETRLLAEGVAELMGTLSSGPFLIGFEIAKLEAEWANELHKVAYASISMVLSARVFGGQTVNALKNKIRGFDVTNEKTADTFFYYITYGDFLSSATWDIKQPWRQVWWDVLLKDFPWDQENLSKDVVAYLRSRDPMLKTMVGDHLKDAALAYLDQQYLRIFKEMPK